MCVHNLVTLFLKSIYNVFQRLVRLVRCVSGMISKRAEEESNQSWPTLPPGPVFFLFLFLGWIDKVLLPDVVPRSVVLERLHA